MMTGEMSRDEVTRESYPLHFALGDKLGGTVRPFDQYQGPFLSSPRGVFWLISGDGYHCRWYEGNGSLVSESFAYDDSDGAAAAGEALAGGIGFPVDDKGNTISGIQFERDAGFFVLDDEGERITGAFETLGEAQTELARIEAAAPVPLCVFCSHNHGIDAPAEFVAAQSTDAGATVEWVLICGDHREGWNSGGDWRAPCYRILP
jgi:hypothetical protein